MPRPLAFDPDEKLHQAMLLFWRKGFEATSMQDLVNVLGINRFSIYNTFGDKQALYTKAVAYYEDKVFGALLVALQPPEQGLQCLREYFRHLNAQLQRQSGLSGCFLQTAVLSNEIQDPDARQRVGQLFERLRGAMLEVLNAAQQQRQISEEADCDALADFLLLQSQGLIVLHGLGKGAQAGRAIKVLEQQIDHW